MLRTIWNALSSRSGRAVSILLILLIEIILLAMHWTDL